MTCGKRQLGFRSDEPTCSRPPRHDGKHLYDGDPRPLSSVKRRTVEWRRPVGEAPTGFDAYIDDILVAFVYEWDVEPPPWQWALSEEGYALMFENPDAARRCAGAAASSVAECKRRIREALVW